MPFVSAQFPRSARLLTQSEFRQVFKKPCKSVDSCFTVLACANTKAEARLGLAISKKQLRRAVDRNRIKRLIRESFRRHRHGFPGLDIVVIARSGLRRKGGQKISDSLWNHWQKLATRCRNF